MIPWSNVWEAGTGGRAIEFADEGYKVSFQIVEKMLEDTQEKPQLRSTP